MFITLPLLSTLTSIISAIVGMGGGILLLSMMTIFIPINIAIPIHGIVQLVSNSSRVFYLKNHIKWKFYFYYLIGLPLGAMISTILLRNLISKNHMYIMLISLICYALFKPKKLPNLNVHAPKWIYIGIATGITSILVGAVGPLIAPFFLRDDFSKEEIISTKAIMQMSAHIIKIPAFLFLNFHYSNHLELIVLMSLGAIIGTKIGIKVLSSFDRQLFRKLYKFFLGLAGARLIVKFLFE